MASEHKQHWLDRYWMVLLSAFGIFCILGAALWHPHW